MATDGKPLNPAARERRFIVRAGLFIALGLAIGAFVIVTIGKERRFFDQQMTYVGAFDNVDGLQLDAPVRLGGLTVGRVSNISFAPDLGDKRIIVQMEVSAKFGERVRSDSVARVTSRGVLGDKAIDISLGSPDAPLVHNLGEIQTGSSGDLSSLMKASGEIIDNSVQITKDLRAAVAAYTDPQLRSDLAALVKSAKNVMGEIEHGNGPLHAMVYDKKSTEELKALIVQLRESSVKLDGAITQAQSIMGEVKEGDGAAHAIIYDKKAAQAITQLGEAATELASLVHDAKESKNGAVHQLVYGDARGIFSDLGQAASDIKQVTGKVKAGEGSLGAIINDPTVYEDLKEVLGNVKRNRVLRELVRLSISNEEEANKAGQKK